MSNLPSGNHGGNSSSVNEEVLATPLVVAAPVRGEDVTAAVEAEVLPSVKEIISCNLEAKLDLQQQPEAVTEVFRSFLTSKHLAKFKAKYYIPDQE